MKAKKLILVTSEAHPMNKAFINITEELSKEIGVEKEVRNEDYAFLSDYGEKDEFGMSWLPQLFLVLDDNRVYPILTQMPLGPDLKADPEKGKKEALDKIKSLVS
ncbi:MULTISPECIES: hypothetical protein [Acidianus]|uniref:Thioredoxin n=1 Tax=Candidatus Acidianus copahuensis TaxID=1160895 RepID=A0A031LPR0_9CREN|nr:MULTISPECIES: hypothetical protein [Acidianus]EZQ06991.1 hypothetical protein CM19_06430 [Candidatus Acidianus copahuensis]NON61874.1 hypothetical protein [Acidianus sp. RZ1]